MPSKYKRKLPKPQMKQDAELPYKKHYAPCPARFMCDTCGRFTSQLCGSYKCLCGGTYQMQKPQESIGKVETHRAWTAPILD